MRSLLRTLLVFALVVGAYVAYRTHFGKHAGEPCGDSSDCAKLFDVQCLRDPSGSYCTSTCAADNDCPAGWHCAQARELGEAGTQSVCSRAVGTVHAPTSPAAPAPRARTH